MAAALRDVRLAIDEGEDAPPVSGLAVAQVNARIENLRCITGGWLVQSRERGGGAAL